MDQEDRLILALLEASEGANPETLEALQEDSDEGRAYTELLGLIPRELPPTTPSPEIKKRLMAAVSEGRARYNDATSGEEPSVGEVVPLRSRRPQGDAATRVMADRPARRTSRKATSWKGTERAVSADRFRSFLVAAVIAFMMIGVSGWFYLQLQEQRETVAQLHEELRATNLRLEELDAGRRDVVASLRDVGMMPPEPVMWCPLRPSGEEPPQPYAHGSLLLAMHQGRWSVRIHNLEPAAAGKVYVLWFLDEEAPLKKVNLGRGDRPVQISATGVPQPMTAAAVTLEPSMDITEPTGPRVLYGHRREMDRL